ncbi:hypothetical protein LINPERHAP2_LOCUS29002 [Linum perenne]
MAALTNYTMAIVLLLLATKVRVTVT